MFIINFLKLTYAATNNWRYQPLINDTSLETDWIDTMVQTHIIINEYIKEVNNESNINFGAFFFLSSSDIFMKILKSSREARIIRPWKGFCNNEDKNICLKMLENDLKHEEIILLPRAGQFMQCLDWAFRSANQYKLNNFSRIFTFKGIKIKAISREEELFIRNFISVYKLNLNHIKHVHVLRTNNKTINARKEPFLTLSVLDLRVIINMPKFMFIQNHKNEDLITQQDLEKIPQLKYKEAVYDIIGIFLVNQENNTTAVLIKKEGEWISFFDGKYERKHIEFKSPWYVSLAMYENPSNESDKKWF